MVMTYQEATRSGEEGRTVTLAYNKNYRHIEIEISIYHVCSYHTVYTYIV